MSEEVEPRIVIYLASVGIILALLFLIWFFVTPILFLVNITLNWFKDSYMIPSFYISRQHSAILDWYFSNLVYYFRISEYNQTNVSSQGDFWQYWWVWFLFSG